MIVSLNPDNLASATVSVTLTGMDFGPSDATVTAVLALRDCSTTTWVTSSSVACIGTLGDGEAGSLGLTVADIVGTRGPFVGGGGDPDDPDGDSVFSFDG